MSDQEQVSESQEIDVDALYNSIMSPEAPAEETKAQESEHQESEGKEQSAEEDYWQKVQDFKFKLKRGDEYLEVEPDKLRNLAQQGFDYNKKMRDLKLERQEFESKSQEYQEKIQRAEELAKYDDFLKQNPQIEEQIRQALNMQRAQQTGYNSNSMFSYPGQQSPEVLQLKETVQQLQERLAREDNQKRMAEEADKEAKLDNAINTTKEQFKYFDWDSVDEDGFNLEQQVMQHAIDKGIKDFTAALRDFKFDEIIKHQTLAAKEQASKTIQKQNKLGIREVNKSPGRQTPEKKSKYAKRGYDAIVDEIYEEFGIQA